MATAVAFALAVAQAASGQTVPGKTVAAPGSSVANAPGSASPAGPPVPPPPAPPPDPSLPVVTLGQTINGSLGSGDTVQSAGLYRDSFTLMGHQGQRVEVSMTGGFDTYLTLSGPGVNQTNDDDPAASNPLRASRVAATLPQDGAYVIIASSLGAASGRYRLNVIDPAGGARGAALAEAAHHFTLGDAALAQDNPRRAFQEYSTVLRLDPMNAAAWVNRGVSQYRLGHFRFAAEDFERAGQIDPNTPNVQSNRQSALAAEDALQARRASGEGDWSGVIRGVVSVATEAYVANHGGTTAPSFTAPTYAPPAAAAAPRQITGSTHVSGQAMDNCYQRMGAPYADGTAYMGNVCTNRLYVIKTRDGAEEYQEALDPTEKTQLAYPQGTRFRTCSVRFEENLSTHRWECP